MIFRLLLMLSIACSVGLAQECTRILPVNVTDRATGRSVDTFTADQLHARVGSLPLPISSLDKFAAGRVLVLIDVSGSMEHVSMLVKHLGPALVRENPSGAQMAFGFFNSRIVISPQFTADPRELDRIIEQANATPSKGRTLLLDAIHQGLKLFGEPRLGDSMVIVTDGDDNDSVIRRRQIEDEVKAAGVRMFSVLMKRPFSSGSAEIQEGEERLDRMAKNTGGAVYTIPMGGTEWRDPEFKQHLNDALLILWRESVLRGYSVTLKTPSVIKKGQWKLEITHDDRPEIHYPQYLGPCNVP